MASTLFKSASISSSVSCPKWLASLLGLVSGKIHDSPRPTLAKTSCSKSAAELAKHKNRGFFFCGTVVKTFGRLYNEFLPTKRSIVQENGVRRAHEVPTRQGARPGGRARPPPSWMPRVPFRLLLIFLIFEIFQNGEKLPLELFWSRFTYRTTYLFLFGV